MHRFDAQAQQQARVQEQAQAEAQAQQMQEQAQTQAQAQAAAQKQAQAQELETFELSLPQEITLQDLSSLPLRPQPRHAASPSMQRGEMAVRPRAAAMRNRQTASVQEGFQAQYQLVISLKPLSYPDGFLQVDHIQVEQALQGDTSRYL